MSSEAAQKAARQALGMGRDEPNRATGEITRGIYYERVEAFDIGAAQALAQAAEVFGKETPEGKDLLSMAVNWGLGVAGQ